MQSSELEAVLLIWVATNVSVQKGDDLSSTIIVYDNNNNNNNNNNNSNKTLKLVNGV